MCQSVRTEFIRVALLEEFCDVRSFEEFFHFSLFSFSLFCFLLFLQFCSLAFLQFGLQLASVRTHHHHCSSSTVQLHNIHPFRALSTNN